MSYVEECAVIDPRIMRDASACVCQYRSTTAYAVLRTDSFWIPGVLSMTGQRGGPPTGTRLTNMAIEMDHTDSTPMTVSRSQGRQGCSVVAPKCYNPWGGVLG